MYRHESGNIFNLPKHSLSDLKVTLLNKTISEGNWNSFQYSILFPRVFNKDYGLYFITRKTRVFYFKYNLITFFICLVLQHQFTLSMVFTLLTWAVLHCTSSTPHVWTSLSQSISLMWWSKKLPMNSHAAMYQFEDFVSTGESQFLLLYNKEGLNNLTEFQKTNMSQRSWNKPSFIYLSSLLFRLPGSDQIGICQTKHKVTQRRPGKWFLTLPAVYGLRIGNVFDVCVINQVFITDKGRYISQLSSK